MKKRILGLEMYQWIFMILMIIGIVVTLVVSSPTHSGPEYNISSHNQLGGITAGVVNISSSTQRHLDATNNIAELSKYLPSSKTTKIQILYIMGNAEAKQYASEIQTYLKSRGWKVDPELGSFQYFDEPVVGIRAHMEDRDVWWLEVGSAE